MLGNFNCNCQIHSLSSKQSATISFRTLEVQLGMIATHFFFFWRPTLQIILFPAGDSLLSNVWGVGVVYDFKHVSIMVPPLLFF